MINSETERFYGNLNIEGLSGEELMDKSLKLLPSLFAIDLSQDNVPSGEFDQILDLLEIVRFSPEYPWLIGLGFATNGKVERAEVIRDPHYDDSSIKKSIFKGQVLDFPNFVFLWQHPKVFINQIGYVAQYDGERKPFDVYLAGTKSKSMVLGRPNDTFLRNKEVVYKLPETNIDPTV